MTQDRDKQVAAEAAVDLVQDGMTLGLGTGSTAAFALLKLGERARGGLHVRGVASSHWAERMAREQGIPLVGFDQVTSLDLTIDGADEIGPDLSLIKGGGGALFREKIVAAASRQVVIIADGSKRVPQLGRFPLPVEVNAFGWQVVARRITELGAQVSLRLRDGQPFVTDNGGLLLDCRFGAIAQPAQLQQQLRAIVGVMETGLFVGLAHSALVAQDGRVTRYERPPAP
ncbi:MAG TPA: ribose-5-phosphate isomerase RpiA [bacterium]|nr:ribose-5-phosphate isomerase RpiA [bacterium]